MTGRPAPHRPAALLAQLCHDPAWSNEGLFALLQGFRRLAAIDEGRVNLPTINLEV